MRTSATTLTVTEIAIRFAMHHAASIMDAYQLGHHALAAQWLVKAALAHKASGREDGWQPCRDEPAPTQQSPIL